MGMSCGSNNDSSRNPYGASRSYGQEKIVDWLAFESRLDQVNCQSLSAFNLEKTEGFPWPEARFTKDGRGGDLQSTISVDDTLSHSGSSHESLISDSSSQTSSSSATDPFDFLDDSDRDSNVSSKANCIEQDFFRQTSGFLGASTSSTRQDQSRTRQVRVDGLSTCAESSVEQNTSQTSSVCQPNKHAPPTIIRNNNARRSSCLSKTKGPPCKLKRDTECTDQFVSLLIVFATRLITAIWPLSACPPMMTACFNGAGVLPLQVFIQETLKRSRTSYSTLQVALYYLVLLRARLPAKDFCHEQGNGSPDRKQCRAMQCGRRMFLSALMLASKYLQDRNYSARAWSKISGLRSTEINENEREYLSLIDYSLHVPKDVFDNWNKIVIALSKLSKEEPQCRMDLSDSGSPFDPSDDGAYNTLSDAGSHDTFSDDWWSDIISKLNVETIKDASITEAFLAAQVPLYRGSSSPSLTSGLGRCEPSSAGLDLLPAFMDINFSESLKSRHDQPRSSALQTPTQMSPVRAMTIPMQPRLRNLPTPQTTPKLADGHQDHVASNSRLLRWSASLDALRNMRRQCLVNANLDRCPPPRRPVCEPSTTSTLNLPAEIVSKSPERVATPSISSPASATSDSTASFTSRSRSSSISSVSSCSSFASSFARPRFNDGCSSSSPLAARSCLPNRGTTSLSKVRLPLPDISGIRFMDEGYGSGEDPPSKLFKQAVSSSEEKAVEILMSLSVQSENQSQCVTPTPHNYDVRDEEAMISAQRGHKRSLSKVEPQVQSHVRAFGWDHALRGDVLEDSSRASNATPKQWQCPSKAWAEPKRALPNASDSKRVAYCALQQYASAPDLASQYLQDIRISATS
ncbi:hypothetical protein B0A52_06939 [Exophiala mesophila]|uniref:Cyclin N-terminal domain-containing protein n=1 Tax=Exophiala mesophila TaxID=212818 RepID=A0A438N107_EXOME|nr:hypothetical protein B0A52_06939 [Exophiala mesophila]